MRRCVLAGLVVLGLIVLALWLSSEAIFAPRPRTPAERAAVDDSKLESPRKTDLAKQLERDGGAARPSDLKGRLVAHGTQQPVSPGSVVLALIDAKTQQDRVAAEQRPTVSVDASGHFAFRALEPGFYRVNASAEGLGRARPIFLQIPSAAELVIEIGEQGTLDGHVVDASGRGVPDAVVRADTRGDSSETTSGAGGAFTLAAEAGSYRGSSSTSRIARRSQARCT